MDEHDVVRFTTRPTTGDILWNAAALLRRSAVGLVVGTFTTAASLILIALGDLPSAIMLAFGLALLSGTFAVPFVWWSIRQRRDLILAPVEVVADRDGISLASTVANAHQNWSFYRRARETSRAFLLNTGAGGVVPITKRGMDEAEVAAFRGMLQRVGLLAPLSLSERLRPLLWVAVGLVVVGALTFVPRFIGGIGATATLELAPTVQGHAVSIHGTTDLPDGAVLVIELIQLDQWQRESSDGVAPEVETSPWARLEYVIVQAGRFEVTSDVTGWPAGRGIATAYFWIDPTQPDAVIARFGARGERLRGPDVVGRDDRGPTLDVERSFDYPG